MSPQEIQQLQALLAKAQSQGNLSSIISTDMLDGLNEEQKAARRAAIEKAKSEIGKKLANLFIRNFNENADAKKDVDTLFPEHGFTIVLKTERKEGIHVVRSVNVYRANSPEAAQAETDKQVLSGK